MTPFNLIAWLLPADGTAPSRCADEGPGLPSALGGLVLVPPESTQSL